MKTAGRDVLYFETGPGNVPTLTVGDGEEFRVLTQINRGPWLNGHPEEVELKKKLRGGNPSSGCIFVEGAQPGALLGVHILDIEPDEIGFTCFTGSTGAMPGYFGSSGVGSHEKTVRVAGGFVEWSSELSIPARPMLGFVGVSPQFETHHNGWAGTWGGNLDMPEVCAGASVYLPVEVEGALLHVGDMHAVQGDGEICGAGGIETGGTARIRCSLHERPSSFRWPRVENETHIIVAANAKPAEDAFRLGLEDLIMWMDEDYGIPPGEAYLLLGQVLEARVTQFVNPTYTYCVKVEKKYLGTLG